ncbi:MAG: hypothetical protein PQJ59_14195 [Spirochaetales bacterium]|nr:hypothetical protein [Spirochaetales bacterium]
MKKHIFTLILIITASLLFASGKEEKSTDEIIRIGYLPDAGTLPLFLMDNVEMVPFMSALERNTAMQIGELDGMMSDLVSLISFRTQGVNQSILTITESRFQIVGAKGLDESGVWPVGLSENTIVEFMVDQLVPSSAELDKIAIPQVPVRLEMLRTGQIPLACLTDILALSLPGEEFVVIRDQKETGLEPAVLVFSDDFLEANPGMGEKLQNQWNEAVKLINGDPDSYSALLYEKARIPEDSDYDVPHFRSITLPDENTVETVLDWYEAKYGLETRPAYEDLLIPLGD